MFYKLSKVTFVFFLFYIGWFQDVFFIIPRVPLTLGGSMIALLFLHKLCTSKKESFVITKPVTIWLIFSFYVLLSGFFVAFDKILLIDSLLTYIQTLAVVVYLINVSAIEKNNKFFIKTYLIYSIVYMVTMLFWGIERRGGRLHLSTTSNPNGDALTLLAGVFCALYLFNSKKISKFIMTFGLVGVYVYTIVMTGSRKTFLVVCLLIALWIVFVFKKYWRVYSGEKKLISAILLLTATAILIVEFVPLILESTLFRRFIEKGFMISSDPTRSGMYREAYMMFTGNPLFGVGFNQYRLLSVYGTYSHSTYAEIISTTGIFGTVLYFTAYIVIIYNLLTLYKKEKGSDLSIKAQQYLILMISMLVLGIGVIHFYSIRDYIMFALMISFYYNEKTKQKQLIKCKKSNCNNRGDI